MRIKNNYQEGLLLELLQFWQDEGYHDVRIICGNGILQLNSLLLAAVFPVLRNVLSSTLGDEGPHVISIPDIDKIEMEHFLYFLFNKEPTFNPSQSIFNLLTAISKVVKEENPNTEESIKSSSKAKKKESRKKMASKKERIKEENYMSVNNASEFLKTEMDVGNTLFSQDSDEYFGFEPLESRQNEEGVKPAKKKHKLKTSWRCHICEKEFSDRPSFKKHMNYCKKVNENVDKSKLQCHLCDFVGAWPKCLKLHIKVKHLNIRESFTCEICGSFFTTRSAVNLHKSRIHEGVKYSCDVENCGYTAKSKQKVMMHKQAKHEGIEYMCDKCSKTFSNKYRLKKHVDTVHSDFILACDKCDYKTKSKERLKEHTRGEHEGQKISCSQCDFKTTWMKNLKSHIQSKHPTEIFYCDKCSFSTTLQRKLNSHSKIMHPEISMT